MKFAKSLSLFLALLMLLSAFVACNDTPEETTTEEPGETTTPDENERDSVKDSVPTDLKYKDEEVTFLVRDGSNMSMYELACEELINDPLYDAIHYRNIDVEQRLGVKMNTVARPGNYGDHDAWNEIFSTSVLNNTGDYDGCGFYLSTGTALAKEGLYYNLLNLTKDEDGYLDFEKPWWNQSMVDELSVFGALFFAGGALTIQQTAGGSCIFFNKDLFDEKYPEESHEMLYQLVRDQAWTADEMAFYVSHCWDDVNSNGVIDNGDTVGIKDLGPGAGQMDAWIYALGLDVTTTDIYGDVELALFNSRTVPAYEKLREIYTNNPGAMIHEAKPGFEDTTMANGNVLFFTQSIGFGEELRASEVNYGILPLPKFDAEQEDYRTCFSNSATTLAIASNLNLDRAAMVSALLELLSAESYKQVVPVYYETVLKGHYSKDAADAEMFDRILDTFVFSFGFAYSSMSLDGISNIFRRLSTDYDLQHEIDSRRSTWEVKLDQLLLALEAVS